MTGSAPRRGTLVHVVIASWKEDPEGGLGGVESRIAWSSLKIGSADFFCWVLF